MAGCCAVGENGKNYEGYRYTIAATDTETPRGRQQAPFVQSNTNKGIPMYRVGGGHLFGGMDVMTFEGHEYLVFYYAGSGLSAVHSESCPCHRNN